MKVTRERVACRLDRRKYNYQYFLKQATPPSVLLRVNRGL